MGYEVDFDISKNSPEARKLVVELSGYPEDEFDSRGVLSCVTWYNCEQDFKAASKLLPDKLLQVTIHDPHEHTSYRQYFYNGEEETVKAVATFPETTFTIKKA